MMKQDLLVRFPELDPIEVDKYFDIHEATYYCYFNENYNANTKVCDKEIILNLLAHLITTSINTALSNAPTRQTTSESAGSLSASYTTSGEEDPLFSSTIYGQTFKTLLISHGGMYFV